MQRILSCVRKKLEKIIPKDNTLESKVEALVKENFILTEDNRELSLLVASLTKENKDFHKKFASYKKDFDDIDLVVLEQIINQRKNSLKDNFKKAKTDRSRNLATNAMSKCDILFARFTDLKNKFS